jgi:nucleotide-binding universal stress UspA family protein
MILLAYDGSADAEAALDHTARLLPGVDVTVLTVWTSFPGATVGGLMGMDSVYVDPVEADRVSQDAAVRLAAEGAARAAAAGLNARADTARSGMGVGAAIASTAARLDADAIVVGTRGLTGLKSFFLGSVSHAVLQHADRPVLVVPSGRVAEDRREWVQRAEAS